MMLFRADANSSIGMGHVMRCLSIADAARSARKEETVFVLADDAAADLVRSRGNETIILNSDYRDMESELKKWPAVNPEAIIVDSYFATAEYLGHLRDRTDKLVYIDDLGAFPYPVDVLVNYNAYGPYMDYKTLYSGEKEPQYILGPMYAPLRAMFREAGKRIQPEEAKNILISTGGSDEMGIAFTILSFLRQKGLSGRTYHFLIGAMNKYRERIREIGSGMKGIVLHENVTDMKNLISGMDIAVSAAGSTLYEICACGVPLITYVMADNQIPGAEAFDRLGLAVNLGDMREKNSAGNKGTNGSKLRDDAVVRIVSAIESLAGDYSKRRKTGNRMQEMIDGYGADRMIAAIFNS